MGNHGKLLSRVPDVVFEAHADVIKLFPLKIFMLELVVLEVDISYSYVFFHSIHTVVFVIDFHAKFELSVNLRQAQTLIHIDLFHFPRVLSIFLLY